MPTPDPKDWLLTPDEAVYATLSVSHLQGTRSHRIARAQLLKALKGVEEWLDKRIAPRRGDGYLMCPLCGDARFPWAKEHEAFCALRDLAAARARLESEGR